MAEGQAGGVWPVSVLVSLNTVTGDVQRYECGGTKVRCTHSATLKPWPAGAEATINTVRDFRLHPPEHLRHEETAA